MGTPMPAASACRLGDMGCVPRCVPQVVWHSTHRQAPGARASGRVRVWGVLTVLVACLLLAAAPGVQAAGGVGILSALVVTSNDGGSDTITCGDVASPCATVSYAFERVANGGTVAVVPTGAAYVLSAEVDFGPLFLQQIVLASASTTGRPVIECAPGQRAFSVSGTQNLTVREVVVQGCGAGVYDGTEWNGGVALVSGDASVSFQTCDLVHNTASNGGVVYASDNATVTFDDCSLRRNIANNTGGVVAAVDAATVVMRGSQLGSSQDTQPHCTTPPVVTAPEDLCGVNATVLTYNATLEKGVLYHPSSFVDEPVRCKWELRVPEGTGMRLDFCDTLPGVLYFFDRCDVLTIKITDGVSGQVLYDGCGMMMPILAPSHIVYVEYHTDSNSFLSTPLFLVKFMPDSGNLAMRLGYGGAVYATDQASASLHDVQAFSAGGYYGGVAAVDGNASLAITGAQWGRGAAERGALVHADGYASVTVQQSVLQGSQASFGGGFVLTGNVQAAIHSGTEMTALAGYEGGAVYTDGAAVLNVSGATFSESSVNNRGGAVAVGGDARASFVDCQFHDNHAPPISTSAARGACIYAFGAAVVNVTGAASRFVDNTAMMGAVFVTDGDARLAVTDAYIADNTGDRWSGVIWMTETSEAVFDRCTLLRNDAQRGRGGVAVLNVDSRLVLANSIIHSNTARNNGGVAYMIEGTTVMRNCSVVGNSAKGVGGGVFSLQEDSTELDIADSTFTANNAPVGSGGILYVHKFSPTLSRPYAFRNCMFEDNYGSSGNNGGAMYADGAVRLDIEACRFRGNHAEQGAAMLVASGAILTCDETVFQGNVASLGGAALLIEEGVTATFTRSNFTGNTVTSPTSSATAGGVFVVLDDSHLVLEGCYIEGNSAGNGGVLRLDTSSTASTVTATDCWFVGNTAKSFSGDGGVAVVTTEADDQVSLVFTDCYIVANTAALHGGAFDVDGNARLEFHGSLVTENEATLAGGGVLLTNGAQLFMYDSRLLANAADNGGAVYADIASQVHIERGVLDANLARDWGAGGMLWLGRHAVATISHSIARNNTAGDGSVVVTNLDSQLTVRSSDLRENEARAGGAVVAAYGVSIVTIQGSVITLNMGVIGGVVSAMQQSTVTLQSCRVLHNLASYGAVVFGTNKASTVVRDSEVVDNTSAQEGGVVVAQSGFSFDAYNTTFDANASFENGGVVDASGVSVVRFFNCTLTECAADLGGAAHVQQQAELVAQDTVFESNHGDSGGGAVFFDGTTLGAFTRCHLEHNEVLNDGSGGGAIGAIDDAMITMEDTVMRANTAHNGGGMAIANDVHFTAYRSVFDGNAAEEEGGVVDMLDDTVARFIDSRISYNRAGAGGAVEARGDSHVFLHNVTVIGNVATRGAVLQLTMVDVHQEEHTHRRLQSQHRQHQHQHQHQHRRGVRSRSGRRRDGDGERRATRRQHVGPWHGAASLSAQLASASATRVAAHLRDEGLRSSARSLARSSLAGSVRRVEVSATPSAHHIPSRDLTGTVSPAVVAGMSAAVAERHRRAHDAVTRGTVKHGLSVGRPLSQGRRLADGLSKVSALISNSTVQLNSGAYGAVIDLDGPYTVIMKDHMFITDSSVFSNFASQGGGVLYWTMTNHPNLTPDSPFDFLLRTTMWNNSAVYHGDVIATGPTRLFITADKGVITDTVKNFSLEIHSAQQIQVPIRALAVDGINSAMSGTSMDLLVQARVVGSDAPGSQPVVYGQILASGDHANVVFEALTVEGAPGSEVYVEFSALAPNHLKPSVVTFHIANCVAGEVRVQDQCVPCEKGFYSWDPLAAVCLQCPAHAVCPGGSIVIPEEGYWRPTHNSTEMVRCSNPAACLGSTPFGTDPFVEGCLEGYTGNLCGACSEGYAHSDRLTCSKCPSDADNALILSGVLVAALLLMIVVVQIQRHIGKKGMDTMTMVVKILASYYQFVSVANSLDVFWPPAVLDLFQMQSSITSAGGQLMFLECLLQSPTRSISTVFYTKTLIYILVAPTMVLGAALFWFIVYLYRRFFRRSERRTVPELKRIGVTNATVTIIVTLFLLHPSVTEKVLELTTCLEIIPGSGRRFLQANPDVECQTPEHTAWLLAAGLPGFVFIVAGVPVAAFLLLRSLYGSLNERFVKEKYGFLFLGYTRENYYWEIVIVARKVAIIVTAELLAQFGYLVQIMGAMMVTFLAFLTHVGASPYVNRKLYRLDSAALLISLGTFSLGAFQAEDMPDWAQIVVAGLVIATNVGFLLFVAFYVRREIIFYIHECVDDLRDLFGLCCSCCRRARADSATSSDALTPKTKSLEDGDGDGSHRSKRSRRGRSKGGQGVDTPNPVMQMEMEMVSREGSSGSTGRPARGSGSSDDSHASHGGRDTATAAHAAPPSPALAPSSKPPNVPPPTAPTMPPPAASRRDRRARHGSSGSHATEDGAGSPGRRRRGGSASSTAAAAGGGGAGGGAGAGAGPSAQVIRRSELHPRPARTTMQSLEAASATKHRRRRKQRTRATAVPSEELDTCVL